MRGKRFTSTARGPLMAALRRDRRGAAAAEFALIVPLLALFLFAIIQFGLLLFTYGSMLNSARTAARDLAFGLSSEADAQASAEALLVPWAAGAATITADADDSGLARVQISVPSATAGIVRFVPVPGTLDVDVAMPRIAVGGA